MRCPRHRGVPRPKPSRCRSCTASRRRLPTHASPMPLCIQPAPAAVPGAPPHACAAHVQATLQLLALSIAPPPMPALASTLPPALPRPPVDPIGFLMRALAHVRTATTLLPAATVEAPLQLPASSVAPPFMPALAFALPPALPRSPAEPIDLLVHALAHVHAATALPPAAPRVEAPLQLGAFSAGPPFPPALASAFPPTLPRSPTDSTSLLAPALAHLHAITTSPPPLPPFAALPAPSSACQLRQPSWRSQSVSCMS